MNLHTNTISPKRAFACLHYNRSFTRIVRRWPSVRCKVTQELLNNPCNWCVWLKKGSWQTEEDSFISGFSFRFCPGTLRTVTLHVMAICATTREPLHDFPIKSCNLYIGRHILLSAKPFIVELWSIPTNVWGTWLNNLGVFTLPQFSLSWRVHLAQWTQYRKLNLSAYLLYLSLSLSLYLFICVSIHLYQTSFTFCSSVICA